MKGLSKIHGFWLFIPIVFITIAAVLVTVTLTWRIYRLEIEDRINQKLILESLVYAESAKVAEEFYLSLDNLSAREKQLTKIFNGRGTTVKLRFERVQGGIAASPIDHHVLQWMNVGDNRSAEQAIMPLMFGDKKIGDLTMELDWREGWHLKGLDSILFTLGCILALIIIAWVVASQVFRHSILQPFVESVKKMSRWEAAAETTQMLAHDVRKPFHMMQFCLNAIQSAKGPENIQRVARDSVSTIQKMSTEVLDLLQDLLDFERGMEPKVAPVNLKELIDGRLVLLEKSIDEKRCEVSIEIDPSLVILVDELQIRRVVTNILRNALQAIDDGDRIWVRAVVVKDDKGKSFVEVCIGNSGPVIPAKDLDQLFDRFFTQGKPDGTGLGLAIAKKFVVAHGGQIWCESGQDKGAEFFVLLPVK